MSNQLANWRVVIPEDEMSEIQRAQTDFFGKPFPVERPATAEDLRGLLLTDEMVEIGATKVAEAWNASDYLLAKDRRIARAVLEAVVSELTDQ